MRNSTIRLKEKICISCGRPCIWFSKKRCQQCAKVESFHAKEEKEAEEDLGDLIKDADIIISRYIRLKYSDANGVIKCYTCDKEMDFHEAQCGHFVSRSVMYLRHDPRNLRVQCNTCNCYKRGNIKVYRKKLNEESPGLPDILYEEAHLVHRVGRDELRAIIADYSNKIKLLKK